MALTDSSGRKINYLRLSVTDRCNMRCLYCMPATGITKCDHGEILNYEQIVLLAEAAVSVGIEKIRVTGGEPLVRAGIVDLLAMLANISGLQQLVLTTNGVRLATMAQQLKDAGVQRLNISLDSLRPEMFTTMTRRNYLAEVLAGIDAAERVGLPYKINTVVMRGWNDNEIIAFAKLSQQRNCTVRFIEYMPTLKKENWQSLVVPSVEIIEKISDIYPLTPVVDSVLAGPAQEYNIAGSSGGIGVIAPHSDHFCRNCNRIRVTSSGKIKTCLFGADEFDLQPLLRSENVNIVAAQLRQLVKGKPPCHLLKGGNLAHSGFSMAQIGG